MVKRGDIWLVALGPTLGSEIRRTRPCLIVSPPELHEYLRTVIVAPLTTKSKASPYRVPITLKGTRGLVLLDQIRTVDKTRLVRRLGAAGERTLMTALRVLQEMFAA